MIRTTRRAFRPRRPPFRVGGQRPCEAPPLGRRMTIADSKLDVVRREEFGKGAARRFRREGKVPAVLYGHGIDPIHLLLDAHPTMLALRTPNADRTSGVEARSGEVGRRG